uniref:Nucleotide-diphospho-sugar transferase domain-containing protein n=1 Tax=viral metagenome TaxID=1070528 RepID=A0A6C0D7W7_9ZZZZ
MNYTPFIKDDFLVWTMTSNGYKYLTLNLYESLKKANVPWKLMIVCADRESHNFFMSMNITAVLYKPSISIPVGTSPSQFGSNTFMTFNKIKLDLLEKLRVEAPESVKYITYMDGDIVVFKDFMPCIKSQMSETNTTILFQNDNLYGEPTTKMNGCTGFFCFKRDFEKSPFNVNDMNLWKELREDQVWVNKKVLEYTIPFDYLERNLFPNGVYLTEQRWKKSEPYLIHYNHLVGNTKISMMKKNKHWYLVY